MEVSFNKRYVRLFYETIITADTFSDLNHGWIVSMNLEPAVPLNLLADWWHSNKKISQLNDRLVLT